MALDLAGAGSGDRLRQITKLRNWETFMRGRAGFGVRSLLIALAGCALSAAPAASAASPQALASSSSNPFEGSGPLVPQIINGQEVVDLRIPLAGLGPARQRGRENQAAVVRSSMRRRSSPLPTAPITRAPRLPTSPSEEAKISLLPARRKACGFVRESSQPLTGQPNKRTAVTSVRRDPYYAVKPETKDDVAVLTLEKPLELSAAKSAAAIPLVPAGATPTPGATLSISGYGKEEGAEGKGTTQTATSIRRSSPRSAAMPAGQGSELNSAVLLCAVSPSSSTCQGDSGGPLTEGNRRAGRDRGLRGEGMPGRRARCFTEHRRARDPRLHRRQRIASCRGATDLPTGHQTDVGATPLDYSPLTCEPGAWSGSPTFSYSFQVENASAQLLQSGPGNIFTPPAASSARRSSASCRPATPAV